MVFFFFSSRRRHTRCSRDWSSDVCSSDLVPPPDGEATVIAALPLFPSLVAVIAACHGATAVTSPLPFTMATDPSELIHVTTRPLSTPPFASCNVAKSCTVPPTCRLEDAGLTMTDATGAGGGGGKVVTVTVAVPLFPPLVTVIAAVPVATPVTHPPALTKATAVLLLSQVTARPLRTAPTESVVAAASCTVPPACTLVDDGLTATAATGTAHTA